MSGGRIQKSGGVLLLGLLLAQPAKAATSVFLYTNYYTLAATNLAELQQSLIKARPWKTAADFHATTVWDLRYTLSYREHDGQANVSAVQVTTRITLTLPKWDPPPEADERVRQTWKTYSTNLRAHENGHVLLAWQATAAVEKRLCALGPAATGPEILAAAQRAHDEILRGYREKEAAYDATTVHGLTQGARLPRQLPPPPAGTEELKPRLGIAVPP